MLIEATTLHRVVSSSTWLIRELPAVSIRVRRLDANVRAVRREMIAVAQLNPVIDWDPSRILRILCYVLMDPSAFSAPSKVLGVVPFYFF